MNDGDLANALGAIHKEAAGAGDRHALRDHLMAIPAAYPERPGWMTRLPAWRVQSMFSATKFVVAGVIVALFGGFLLAGVLIQPSVESVPGAASTEPGTFSPTGSLAQPRQGHTATLLPDGRVLVVGGWGLGDDISSASAEVWDPDTGTFSPAGSLAERPEEHTATLLPDGRVLVVGFGDASAEVWDPDTGTFGPAGWLAERRWEHTATLLPDGRVLIAGGGDGYIGARDLAEVWDPTTNTFSSAGSHTSWHMVTALRDGRVLVVGPSSVGLGAFDRERSDDKAYRREIYEQGIGRVPDLVQVWDPATGTLSPAGSPAMDSISTATLLPDDRVLFMGGEGSTVASVWDPATSTFSPTGSPAMDWTSTATVLSDGRVLVIGGGGSPDSAEVWDPDTGTFSPAGSLLAVGSYYEPTALPDGRLLIVGGCVGECYGGPKSTEDNNWVLASVELWDPVANTFGAASSLSEARTSHSATVLPDGRVLVVGGWGGLGVGVHASAEVWDPSDG